ncbi:unnamed protein product [Rhizoctonia solani]|uniref:Uncharacterized protein n=1 Tax=Rhizoctonia solani TaxID=456999 RepID=A0A8H2W4X2_9AGAM|nr:unnamed protein product [Rhizoctonia solani]
MPPAPSKIVSRAVQNLRTYYSSLSFVNAYKKLAHVATGSNILSAIWTRISRIFPSNGAFFASKWRSAAASDLAKNQVLNESHVTALVPQMPAQATNVNSLKPEDWLPPPPTEKLAQTATKSRILPAIWILSLVSVPIGAFIVYNWTPTRAIEVEKEYTPEGEGERVTKPSRGLPEIRIPPSVCIPVVIWIAVFCICLRIPLALGFSPTGVVVGSLAARFQSAYYGAFTPARGLFAMMMAIGKRGMASRQVIVPSACVAFLTALATWCMIPGA